MDRPNNYFVASLSFSNNQLVYLSKYTQISNHYKHESHNTKLYATQYNKSKRIDSLNWLGIKVIGKLLSHDISRAISLGNISGQYAS